MSKFDRDFFDNHSDNDDVYSPLLSTVLFDNHSDDDRYSPLPSTVLFDNHSDDDRYSPLLSTVLFDNHSNSVIGVGPIWVT